jgi:pimeloyl-ACP methyl ester carboxylesterase
MTRVPVLNRIGEYLTPRVLVEQSVRDVYADPSRVTGALVDRYFELLTRQGNRHALNLRMEEVARDLVPERIKTLKLPTLILWGAKDRLVPPVNAHHFQQDIAGSQLVIFPDLAHVPHEEDPRASIVPVRAFLGLDDPSTAAPAASAAASDVRSAERTR